VVLLTLVIAVLNVCLGYAVGVYLGYGPPSLWDAWEALSLQRPALEPSGEQPVPVDPPLPSLDLGLQLDGDSSSVSDPAELVGAN